MRVAIDYTSALSQRAGVGRYTRNLTSALLDHDAENMYLLYAGSGASPAAAPEQARVTRRSLRLPDRALTIGWHRLGLPLPLEALIGSIDVSHGPDFVVPPSRAPSVVTVHDLTYLMTPQFAFPRLRRYLEQAVPRSLGRARRVIAVSEATRRDLLTHYGLDDEAVIAVPNGVSRQFRMPARVERDERLQSLGVRAPYFLTVGTIEPRKNHSTLLRAFTQLGERYPDLSLVIVGRPGWLAGPILEEIAAAARPGRVQLRSDIGDGDLPALYAGAIATVYPSWYEGFGLPVLEAMACGGATIVSDRGALPEVAGQAALTVSPAEPEAIAAAMERLLLDDDERGRLGALGRERAALFTWQRAAAATLQVYREATA